MLVFRLVSIFFENSHVVVDFFRGGSTVVYADHSHSCSCRGVTSFVVDTLLHSACVSSGLLELFSYG